MNDAQAIDAH